MAAAAAVPSSGPSLVVRAISVFSKAELSTIPCRRYLRYRHLMLNVVSLFPHANKDSKIESKDSKGATLNELVELRNCSSCLSFECRKGKDLYLWMAKSPNGPFVKFLVNAVHTMEELKLTGNHLKGSRPLLTFSTNFDKEPRSMLMKELITWSHCASNNMQTQDQQAVGSTFVWHKHYVSLV